MPVQKQPYRIMYEVENHKYFKICNSKLETMRFVKTKIELSKRITITRVVSIWSDKQQVNINRKSK